MNFQKLLPALCCALVLSFVAGCNQSGGGAEPAQRNPQDVLNSVRLKQLTKDLQLTDEQRQKFQVLFDAERDLITKLEQDSNLQPADRATRVTEFKRATSDQLKPLLTPEQLDKYEQVLAKTQKKKKAQ